MTDKQRIKFYLPKWFKVRDAFQWILEDKRLVADLPVQCRDAKMFAPYVCKLFRAIVEKAEALALAERRAVVPDDLRHACNWIASQGKTTSCSRMNNFAVDHFDRLHAVLLNPFVESDDSIWLAMCWEHPNEDTRRRKIRHLRELADEGRIVAIARNAWQTDDIDALSEPRVDSLIAEIKKNAWRRYGTAPNKQQRHEDAKELQQAMLN